MAVLELNSNKTSTLADTWDSGLNSKNLRVFPSSKDTVSMRSTHWMDRGSTWPTRSMIRPYKPTMALRVTLTALSGSQDNVRSDSPQCSRGVHTLC